LTGISQDFLQVVTDQEVLDSLTNQVTSKWQGTAPIIKTVYNITKEELVKPHLEYALKVGNVPCHGHGQNPGNMQRRFHCTTLGCSGWTGKPCGSTSCPLCNIISNGFMCKYAHTGRFGPGLYSSSTPSKAYGYGDKRYMFVTSVVCGLPEDTAVEHSNNTTALDKSQYHSRVIRDTGYGRDECIVYDDAAMIPRYLIEFK